MPETKPTVQHIDRKSRELTKEEFGARLLECYQMCYEPAPDQIFCCEITYKSKHSTGDCTIVSCTISRGPDYPAIPLYLYQDHDECKFRVTEYSPEDLGW